MFLCTFIEIFSACVSRIKPFYCKAAHSHAEIQQRKSLHMLSHSFANILCVKAHVVLVI